MNKVIEKQKSEVGLNSILLKSFDCIMQQQAKMDNKAYIFVGFLTFTYTALHKNCSTIIYPDVILFSVAIPLIISLFPIASKCTINFLQHNKSNENTKKHNIFYYIDIYGLNLDEFESVLLKEYKIANLIPADYKIIEQIIINSRILKHKISLQNIAFILLVITSILPTIAKFIKFVATLPLFYKCKFTFDIIVQILV